MINFYFFTVGSCIASFLGLVIDRFPESSIIRPRSHCDHCQQTLRPLDLIPILSQVLFRFRCRYCQSPLPYWYALFEAWSGLLFLLCYQGLLPISHLFVLLGSCVLAIYDLRSMEYPLLLWLVLHASLIGLLVFLLKKEKDRIPFVPCLFLSYQALLFFTIFSR